MDGVLIFVLGVILLVLVILLVIIVIIYNNLIRLKNNIDKSWANIDVLLKQRSNEIPNLVSTVKGYMTHERQTLESLTKARSLLTEALTLSRKAAVDNVITGLLKTIFAVAENYPQLRANENYLHLQQELSSIEDKVAYARQYYNDSVLAYDNATSVFPGVFFFRLYGKQKKEYLKVPASAQEMPKIDLD